MWLTWLLVMTVATLGCGKTPVEIPTTQMLAGETMGTSYRVKVVPLPGLSLAQLANQIEAELELVNQQMSTYLPESELSRFNASQATNAWFSVSRDTAEVVSLGLEISEQTRGAFDTTVGRLVDAWGFGPSGSLQRAPEPAEIERLLASVGYRHLQARLDPPALQKSQAELSVDLSAIAKGHGVDRVARVLDKAGATDYFIEIGGEVRARGKRMDGTPWRVGIERPVDDAREIFTAIAISDAALATSGNYRNFYISDGRRVSHTIDPRTGQPVQDAIASASVVADNCALADGLATGMMSLGLAEGLKLAEQQGWAVLLMAWNDAGELTAQASPRFAELYPDWQLDTVSDESAAEQE